MKKFVLRTLQLKEGMVSRRNIVYYSFKLSEMVVNFSKQTVDQNLLRPKELWNRSPFEDLLWSRERTFVKVSLYRNFWFKMANALCFCYLKKINIEFICALFLENDERPITLLQLQFRSWISMWLVKFNPLFFYTSWISINFLKISRILNI